MQTIQWDDSLNTGNKIIDSQHKEIFKRFDTVMKALKSGKGKDIIEDTLKFMEIYIIEHFKEEEKLQLSSKYPMYSTHKVVHDKFIEELKSLKKQFNKDGASSVVAIKLNSMLMGWLREHINKMDKEVAKFMSIN